MRVSLIVAVSENGVIGRDGDLPWRLSADLRRFKKLTMGHHIIMGRRTFESIGCLLPGRSTIVVSRQSDYECPGALLASSLERALQLADGDDEVFVCGGAAIYRESLNKVERIYLTRVHAHIDGETTFPETDWSNWTMVQNDQHAADERNAFAFSFQIYERLANAD